MNQFLEARKVCRSEWNRARADAETEKRFRILRCRWNSDDASISFQIALFRTTNIVEWTHDKVSFPPFLTPCLNKEYIIHDPPTCKLKKRHVVRNKLKKL
jgi:hypothetical protein